MPQISSLLLSPNPARRGGLLFYALSAIPVAAIAFLLYYQNTILDTNDMSNYMVAALNVAVGKGAVTSELAPYIYRPGFVSLLSAILTASSFSAEAVVTALASFSAIFLVLLFWLACTLGGLRAGIATVVILLTSPDLLFATPKQMDSIWPMFLLASLLCLLLRPRSGAGWLALLSGLFLGLAIDIKLVAALFALFPLVLRLSGQEFTIRKAALFYAGAAVVVLPFAPKILAELFPSIQQFFSSKLDSGGNHGLLETLLTAGNFAVRGLRGYIFGIDSGTGLWTKLAGTPVLLAAFLFAVVHGIRRDRKLLSIVGAVLLFIPVDIIIGYHNMRLGQNIFGLALMYLLLGYLLAFIIQKTHDATKKPWIGLACGLALTALFAGYQITCANIAISRLWKSTLAYSLVAEQDSTHRTLWGGAIARWVQKNAPPEAGIIAAPTQLASGVYFHLQGTRPVYRIPYYRKATSTPPLFSETVGSGNRQGKNRIDAEYFDAFIREKRIRYLALEKRRYTALIETLESYDGVRRVMEAQEYGRTYVLLALTPGVKFFQPFPDSTGSAGLEQRP